MSVFLPQISVFPSVNWITSSPLISKVFGPNSRSSQHDLEWAPSVWCKGRS